MIADFIGFAAFVVGSRRPLKLGKYVHHCIPRVWGLLIWTFSKKIDLLPAVVRKNEGRKEERKKTRPIRPMMRPHDDEMII